MDEELATRLKGPQGQQHRDALLQQLQQLQARLLRQLGGGGMGVAWAAELAPEDVKNIQTALLAVQHSIEILLKLEFPKRSTF